MALPGGRDGPVASRSLHTCMLFLATLCSSIILRPIFDAVVRSRSRLMDLLLALTLHTESRLEVMNHRAKRSRHTLCMHVGRTRPSR